MSAYYFTTAVTCFEMRPDHFSSGKSPHTWDACLSKIVFANFPDEARKQYENDLRAQSEGEEPREIVIRKITPTPIVDKLLTETGTAPLDWPRILKQMETSMESTPADDFEQGYWVDVDQAVRPEKMSFSIGTLQSDVPEEIRSGLNWSGEKQFLFFFIVLAPPPPPPEPEYEEEPPKMMEPAGEDAGEPEPTPLTEQELYETFPDACNKAAVVLVQARNSVAAAWLWRRYAANLPVAANAIRVEPWPGTLGEPEA